MKNRLTTMLFAIPLSLLAFAPAFAQDEEEEQAPYATPVDTFTCSFNEGQDAADLDKAIADWNAWLDEQGADSYAAITLTPYYYGADSFEIGWLGFWTSQEAMGAGIDNYLANGGKLAERFNEVLTCESHEHWASFQLKAPPAGEMPDNFVLLFSNCSRGEGVEYSTLFEAIEKATAYWTEQGSKSGQWAMWQVFGGGGEQEWDFKWVTSFPNYTEFGKSYQHSANGGGRQKMDEIYGDMLDCDASRVYNARVVRRITAGMDDE